MLATLALTVMAAPMLLVSRLEGTTVQLVTVPVDGGRETVIHSHPLAFVQGKQDVDEGRVSYKTSVHDQVHDNSLVRSVVFALDRMRRRIACLNVVKSHFDTDAEDSSLSEHWTQDLDLMTLDYKGKVLERKHLLGVKFDTAYVGIGDDGRAMLIRDADEEPRGFRLWTEGRWQPASLKDLPASFRSRVEEHDASLELEFGKRTGEEPRTENVTTGEDWTDIDLHRFHETSSVARLSVRASRDAALLLDPGPFSSKEWIDARWGKRMVSAAIDPSKFVPMHLYPLDFPRVVCRNLREDKMLSSFRDHPLWKGDPYMGGEIVVCDLVTKEVRPVCRGILAMPM